jgi:hypothetical protein
MTVSSARLGFVSLCLFGMTVVSLASAPLPPPLQRLVDNGLIDSFDWSARVPVVTFGTR